MYSNNKSVRVGFSIKSNEASPNLDFHYGLYNSREEAYEALGEDGEDVIALGRTVGILTEQGVVEYWWKNGTTLADLVPKHADIGAFVTPQQLEEVISSINGLRDDLAQNTEGDNQVVAMLQAIQGSVDSISERITIQETEQDNDEWDEV